MHVLLNRRVAVASFALLILCANRPSSLVHAQDAGKGELEFVSKVTDDALSKVTSVEISKDGKFLYASAWDAATITVFRRDADSGALTEVQKVVDAENLSGSTALRLSEDGKMAAASAFRSQTAVLYRRDADTGKLNRVDVAKNGLNGVAGLRWAIDVAFSPDSKFLYVVDSHGTANNLGVSVGSVTAFKIEDDKLVFVEAGQDSAFANIRGVAIRPDGETMVVTASSAGTLVVLSRNKKSGMTINRQVIVDELDDAHGLAGAMGVAISPDGRFAYVSSGRFEGDDAVSAFRFDDEDRLQLMQEFINQTGDLAGFDGGNEIVVSPDGLNVYAIASVSSSLACFDRDPERGELTFIKTIPNEDKRLSAGAGLCVSPDGKFVYVAAEQSNTISVFRRHRSK